MSGHPVAGRIWAGRLRVTASITAEQDFECVSGIVQEAVYFEFGDEHPDHGDQFDLMVGLCEDPVVEGQMAVMLFPAVVTIFDADLDDEKVLCLVAGLVRDAIDGWYESPKRFTASFREVGEWRGTLG